MGAMEIQTVSTTRASLDALARPHCAAGSKAVRPVAPASRCGSAWNASSLDGSLWPGSVTRLLLNDSSDLAFLLKAGAQCVSSARWDLWGRRATGVPTAILPNLVGAGGQRLRINRGGQEVVGALSSPMATTTPMMTWAQANGGTLWPTTSAPHTLRIQPRTSSELGSLNAIASSREPTSGSFSLFSACRTPEFYLR